MLHTMLYQSSYCESKQQSWSEYKEYGSIAMRSYGKRKPARKQKDVLQWL